MAPMRRKSQGSIRSPHVKRNVHSQVTFEGWLFKLEGGALKQWKQRWCALVDFCLFFYKAPHEEKVISSVLLPSYKINMCSTQDKISKKFAFKAEHQNMKTYYFATEDKESMKKWMNVMFLATIMQSSSEMAVYDDDSGFTSYRSEHPLKQRSNSCGDRVGEMYLGSDDQYPNLYKTTSSHICTMTEQPQNRKQPLYANAPPKPRRLTQTTDGYHANDHYRYTHEERSIPVNTPYVQNPYPGDDSPDRNQKPPRPRSADFLERDNECATPPRSSYYRQQPQRPKSSLEYYDDYDFDDYRNALRTQADQLYSKNAARNRNFLLENQQRQVDVTKSDPRLNTQYYGSYFTNDVPPPQEENDDPERFSSSDVLPPIIRTSQSEPRRSRPSHNESMQRLLEWKQRMLHSPLSRRNQLHSVSSDGSASKQNDYYHRQQSQYHGPDVSPHQNRHPYDDGTEEGWDDPGGTKNILYCVDSENNEILLSYDTSPTSPVPYFPPQMHSFSTLPNVNAIGIDPNEQQDSGSVGIEKKITYSSDEEESDHRYRPLSGRGSSVSVPDITSKEAILLKQLVEQSNGLMHRGKRLSVSAGDLLGKTHEELVLLLIQLRRNQSKILKAKEKLENNKERVLQIASDKEVCQLEKQYEVSQPLVTLVDNMVKLGSLYGSSHRRSLSLPLLDCAQPEVPSYSQQTSILSRLIAEESDLQKQMIEISKPEKSEAYSLSVLHKDKEMLEHTLFGMQNKILDHQDRPAELQKLRKQQRMIEKELIRVKRLLSTSAKKIEDATSKNDQMEKEILHLRQILQQALKTGSTEVQSQHERADLEAELARLQSVLDELANHRHEINNTVEKLKSEASTSWSKGAEVRASPTGVAGSAPLPLRKKHHCMYLETDLDTMVTRDLAVLYDKDMEDMPVYANAEEITLSNEECVFQPPADPETCSLQDINEADERMKRFYGILPKEKPCEIKTVRIVKRQSERRSRERDKKKVSYDEHSSVWIVDEPSSDEETIVKKPSVPPVNRPSSINLSTSGGRQNALSAHERLFGRKPKRRHYTVSGYQYMLDPQFAQYFSERPRSRDDVDMERCLRTANTPDIVRSTIKRNEIFDDKIIERELGLPEKIEIPERYVEVEPEQLSATEKLRRSLKAENICKMLSQTTTSYDDVAERRSLSEEKRKRAQLLSLNQALAREVVERSKVVAVFASVERMMRKPLTPVEEDLSPMAPLPITQQRYNFLT